MWNGYLSDRYYYISRLEGPLTWKFHGKVLGDTRHVVDALLRWHFEQAVLSKMRAAAEDPVFEFDFPPGADMMGEIRAAPRAAERMEAELFARLYQTIPM